MRQPDIYLLIGDCLRYANVSRDTMPFSLDAADVSVERCYSPGTWTLPSHASVFDVSDPIAHGQTTLDDRLEPSQAELPRRAREHGYATSLFSENPTFGPARGFDAHIDYCDSEINYKLFPSGFSAAEVTDEISAAAAVAVADELVHRPEKLRNAINLVYGIVERTRGSDPTSYPHHGDRVIDHLLSYLSGRRDPQLSFVNLLDPHNPHHSQPPPEGAEPLGLDVTPEESRALAAVSSKDVMLTDRDPPPAVAEEFDTWEAVYERQEEIYEGQVRYTDWLIETFASSAPDRFEDALVVVTGDHGHLFYEEGMVGHHSSLHPGAIHVPLLISVPKGWDDSDRVVGGPVSVVDLARAVSKVVEGEIADTDAFVEELTGSEEVLVVANGPMWNVAELRESYESDAVDELVAKRVGVFRDDGVIEYERPWRSRSITRTEYAYEGDTRRVLSGPTEVESIDDDRIERWIREDESETTDVAVSDRLQHLGYVD